MLNRNVLLSLVMAGAAASMGCAKPEADSCDIKTGGIYVQYEVEERGATATAIAAFWVGDGPEGTYLTFGSCGDSIEVNGESMQLRSDVDNEVYETDLAAADSYDFVFTRQDEDPYSTVVYTPDPPVISYPAGGESISRADTFDITWDTGAGNVELLIEGDCIDDYPNLLGDDVPDSGSHTVAANGIEPDLNDEETSCSVDLTLTREQSGDVNPELAGEATGLGVGFVSFTSTP
ncbi:MAG: hypothetical protein JRI55_09530 [Deltaproteobacteria bacterium]|jgi:hypothetical protein|nr:hypothetical protein [Deltaproteobacteria bacterium]